MHAWMMGMFLVIGLIGWRDFSSIDRQHAKPAPSTGHVVAMDGTSGAPPPPRH